ncbi:hypothetical protein AMECASPLE_014103 [Ameca splendens]|uniref:Dynamin N-terminal domain-containing protein n=1 Tax=Ameca splendens TaxID=208324 RepID=A0ABV0Z046_9TELE
MKITDLKTDKRQLVGVFGKTGAGKTSLINAVIGVGKLLPSGDVDACTSVMIKVEANLHNSKYEAEIEFITKEELEDELETVDHFLEEDGEQEKHDDDHDNDGYHDLVEKLSALYGEEWKGKSSKQLIDNRHFREIPEFDQSTKKILTCESAQELSAIIVKYTKQGGHGEIKQWYWPLVKCVTVKVPNNTFLQHVTLVDLPGNGDRNKSRDTMWKGIVGNCSAVWIVSEINRAASDMESWEILKSANSLLGNGGKCRHIHFICTKSDVIGDLHDHFTTCNVSDLFVTTENWVTGKLLPVSSSLWAGGGVHPGQLKSLYLFASKETLARCASPIPMITGVEEAGCSKSGALIWTVTSQEVRSYPVSWLCRK